MLCSPVVYLRHPLGRDLVGTCNFDLRYGSLIEGERWNVFSIRSAVSYVVAVVNLCVVFRECLAYALRIANVLGVVTPACVVIAV